MKVKNIMFSGAMASILMIGGAYAAYPDHHGADATNGTKLATVSYVRGGVDAAEGYTDEAIADLNATASQTAGDDGLALSITEENGKITAISGSIAANTYDSYGSAAAVDAKVATLNGDVNTTGSVDKKIADALAGAGLDEAENIGERLTAAESDIESLQAEKANSSDVYTKNAADTTFETRAAATAALALKADAATTYTKTEVDGLISGEVSRANGAYDTKGAAATAKSEAIAAVQGDTSETVASVAADILELQAAIEGKQGTLEAGSYIDITDGTVSVTNIATSWE